MEDRRFWKELEQAFSRFDVTLIPSLYNFHFFFFLQNIYLTFPTPSESWLAIFSLRFCPVCKDYINMYLFVSVFTSRPITTKKNWIFMRKVIFLQWYTSNNIVYLTDRRVRICVFAFHCEGSKRNVEIINCGVFSWLQMMIS